MRSWKYSKTAPLWLEVAVFKGLSLQRALLPLFGAEHPTHFINEILPKFEEILSFPL